jgi:hypothetical protein
MWDDAKLTASLKTGGQNAIFDDKSRVSRKKPGEIAAFLNGIRGCILWLKGSQGIFF